MHGELMSGVFTGCVIADKLAKRELAFEGLADRGIEGELMAGESDIDWFTVVAISGDAAGREAVGCADTSARANICFSICVIRGLFIVARNGVILPLFIFS